jgi:hypothetical protein
MRDPPRRLFNRPATVSASRLRRGRLVREREVHAEVDRDLLVIERVRVLNPVAAGAAVAAADDHAAESRWPPDRGRSSRTAQSRSGRRARRRLDVAEPHAVIVGDELEVVVRALGRRVVDRAGDLDAVDLEQGREHVERGDAALRVLHAVDDIGVRAQRRMDVRAEHERVGHLARAARHRVLDAVDERDRLGGRVVERT